MGDRRAGSSRASGPSARGASTRFLADYPEPQRSQILDLPLQAAIRRRLPASQGRDRQRREFNLRQRAFPRLDPRGIGRSEAPRLRVLAHGRGPQTQPARHPRLPALGLSALDQRPLLAGLGRLVRHVPEVARQHYGLELDWIAAAQNEKGTDLAGSARAPPDARRPRIRRRSSSRPPTTTASIGDLRRLWTKIPRSTG